MHEWLDLSYQVLESISPLHPGLTKELVFPAALTCWAQQPWRWHMLGYPVERAACLACTFPSSGNQSLGLEGMGALTFGCVLPPRRVTVRPWGPGTQRLAGFRSSDTARDSRLLQVLWEHAAGYSRSPWSEDQSTRSCFVGREPTCQRKHDGDRPHSAPASRRASAEAFISLDVRVNQHQDTDL